MKIARAAKANQLLKFNYVKESGEKSVRVVRFGSDIPKRLEKQGSPINGRGSWISEGKKSGLRSMIVSRNGKTYVRGTDCTGAMFGKKGEEKTEIKHKIFILSGISFDSK